VARVAVGTLVAQRPPQGGIDLGRAAFKHDEALNLGRAVAGGESETMLAMLSSLLPLYAEIVHSKLV